MNRAQGVAPDSADVNPDRFSLSPPSHPKLINFHCETRYV